MFDLGAFEEAESPPYELAPKSTYIRRPPYGKCALEAEAHHERLRPLAILPDNIPPITLCRP